MMTSQRAGSAEDIRTTIQRTLRALTGSIAVVAVLALAALAAAGCAANADHRDPGQSSTRRPSADTPQPVGRYASTNPGSVNTYWMRAPDGLVLVDTLRTPADARKALTRISQTGVPVVGILLTHSHPDHVGGAGVFHRAYPTAPIYASMSTDTMMREDPRGFYKLTRSLPHSGFPAKLTYPDRTFGWNARIEVGGLALQTLQTEGAESDTSTAYYDPATGRLFSGDLATTHVTPALLEGHSCGWLRALDRLGRTFPKAKTIYPGHGAPGPAKALIGAQREYLLNLRRWVGKAIEPGSAGGRTVTANERTSIRAEIDRTYPHYPLVASLPTLVDENINGVAREMSGEDPAGLPAACAPAS